MSESLPRPPQQAQPGRPTPDGKSARILIADDEEGTLALLATVLTFAGYSVVAARDGLEAIELGRATPPDLALLDVMMPGMDGREVCRRMGADPALTHVPVILHSSADEQDIDWRGCGADAFLAKPFSVRAVPGLVEYHLKAPAGINRSVARRLTDDEVRQLAQRIRQAAREAPGPGSGTDLLALHRELSPEDESRVEAALVALLGTRDNKAATDKASPGRRPPKRRSRGRRLDESADE